MMNHILRQTAAAIIACLIYGNVALAHDVKHKSNNGDSKATFSLEELTLPSVLLKDQDGLDIDLSVLTAGKLVVITFQYTTCQSQCPAANVIMQALQANLKEAKDRDHILLLSITLDPEADSPQVLAQKAKEFGAGLQWKRR